MIGYLRGLVLEKDSDEVVVDVHGVGYRVSLSLNSMSTVPEIGGAIQLRIHTHVRQEALLLYGFATELEQQIFERLISISGIGPKVALAVLSGIEPPELLRAIERSG